MWPGKAFLLVPVRDGGVSPREGSNCFLALGLSSNLSERARRTDGFQGLGGESWTSYILGLALLPHVFLGLIIDNYESF